MHARTHANTKNTHTHTHTHTHAHIHSHTYYPGSECGDGVTIIGRCTQNCGNNCVQTCNALGVTYNSNNQCNNILPRPPDTLIHSHARTHLRVTHTQTNQTHNTRFGVR